MTRDGGNMEYILFGLPRLGCLGTLRGMSMFLLRLVSVLALKLLKSFGGRIWFVILFVLHNLSIKQWY